MTKWARSVFQRLHICIPTSCKGKNVFINFKGLYRHYQVKGHKNLLLKFQNIERRLRENGEDEERIAKYLDIDACLKRLERKLREGSTLETGLRGHNKVSDLANQLSSKLVRKDDDNTIKANAGSKQVRSGALSFDIKMIAANLFSKG